MAAAIEPNPEYGVASSRPRQLPLRSVKYHSPPRLSRKAIHSIRHAAAKLFRELGLQVGGRVLLLLLLCCLCVVLPGVAALGLHIDGRWLLLSGVTAGLLVSETAPTV